MVKNSVIGRDVYIHSRALVEDCVVFDNCDIGRNSKLRRCILEKNVRIPEGTVIGYDLEDDRKKYVVTETGLVVVEGTRTPVQLASITV